MTEMQPTNQQTPVAAPLKTLYDVVANDDLEGIVSLYADMGRKVLLNHLKEKSDSTGALYGDESKYDDDFSEPMTPPRPVNRMQLIDETYEPSASDQSYAACSLRKLEAILCELSDEGACRTNQTRGESSKKSKSSLSRHGSSSSLQSLGDADEKEEVELILQDTAAQYSNSLPASTFVVYDRDNIRSRQKKLSSRLSEQSLDAEAELEEGREVQGERTPLYDGSVANATPGFGPDALGGGGRGTILHLACAMDSPFFLAILLVMGADARSRHTAFRRLMVHEAACADSPSCLRFLLETGSVLRKEADKYLDATNLSGFRFGLPSFLNKKRVSTKYMSSCLSDARLRCFQASLTGDSDEAGKLSYVELVRYIFELTKEIRAGLKSDIEAANVLIARASLSIVNKAAILSSFSSSSPGDIRAKAMYFAALPEEMQKHWTCSSADGQGNTALHWSCFKDADVCVSTLLSYKADPNVRAESSGWTPLHDAAYSNAEKSVSLLIASGANVDAKANSGATPLCFACQEDASEAAALLLEAGADPVARCCGVEGRSGSNNQASRFSGYTPLHYCAHYNSHKAAKVLLEYAGRSDKAMSILEVPDLNEKVPIHVAVSRGSSDVLRELLLAGARVDIPRVAPLRRSNGSFVMNNSRRLVTSSSNLSAINAMSHAQDFLVPLSSAAHGDGYGWVDSSSVPSREAITPVTSPVLRAMLPSHPVTSSKPWNCISQQSIDDCKKLLDIAEMNWSPERHCYFHPSDKRAIKELLKVGKKLEQMGTGIFVELWPMVLSYCSRGWFEPEEKDEDSDSGRRIGDLYNQGYTHGGQPALLPRKPSSNDIFGFAAVAYNEPSLYQFRLDH